LRRFEAVVFLSTHHLARNSGGGTPNGVLGRELLEQEAARLDAGESVPLPDTKGGASLATYFNPCRSFGLMDWGAPGAAPYSVPPRGQEIFNARRASLLNSKLQSLIFDGGSITQDHLDSEGHLFSVNHLEALPRELQLLREALLGPNSDGDADVFKRFQQTIEWALTEVASLEQADSSDLIRTCYAKVTRAAGLGVSATELAWFEYELCRRTHFACELLLSAFVRTLEERPESSVSEVVDAWRSESELPPLVSDTFGWSTWPVAPTQQVHVPLSCLLDTPPAILAARRLRPAASSAYSIGVMIACIAQSQPLRTRSLLRKPDAPLSEIAAFFAARSESTIADLTTVFLTEWLLPRHLYNALRKMAAGGECTLRFFPEGNSLRPTGVPVIPGQSGDRLANVVGVLADVGVFERVGNGSVRTSDLGRHLLAERVAHA
jgi:hypothetical protein